MDMKDNLKSFLETGDDWERKGTSLSGVSLIKLPKTRTRPASLAVEINPVNEKGAGIKKKGIMIMGLTELKAFQDVFSNEKLAVLLTAIEEVIPAKKSLNPEKGDILEI